MIGEYGIFRSIIPPYHVQANPVQRSDSAVKTMIAIFGAADHREWEVHLHEYRHAVNIAMQATTKVSPAFLNFSRYPRPVKRLRREVERERRSVLRLDPGI